MKKLIFPLWIFSAIALFFYSFTQVDLSLTLSRASIFQSIEKAFQYVGYFNRPLSTYIFIAIVLVMFFLYAKTLNLVQKKTIDKKTLWKIIILVSVILFVAYNAFSYDLFNYIFDAKIITHYHSNPYLHKALDYPGDPMLSFMHWTQRTYPYGPLWLVLTVPLSFIGLGYFLLTFYLFKLLMLLSFMGSAVLVEKIAKKSSNALFAVAAFALNPLVLIESLVSAHNDIVMIFFGLLGVYLLLEKKYVGSFLSLIISIAIKFATVLLVPAFLYQLFFKKKNQEMFFYISILFMIGAAVAATLRTNFQPWYLLYILPFAAFLQHKYFVGIAVFIISLFALFQYVPFLYLGNWDPPVPMILNYLLYISVIVSIILIFVKPFIFPKKAS